MSLRCSALEFSIRYRSSEHWYLKKSENQKNAGFGPKSGRGVAQGLGKSPKSTVRSHGFWNGQNASMAIKIIFRVDMDEFGMLYVGIFGLMPHL